MTRLAVQLAVENYCEKFSDYAKYFHVNNIKIQNTTDDFVNIWNSQKRDKRNDFVNSINTILIQFNNIRQKKLEESYPRIFSSICKQINNNWFDILNANQDVCKNLIKYLKQISSLDIEDENDKQKLELEDAKSKLRLLDMSVLTGGKIRSIDLVIDDILLAIEDMEPLSVENIVTSLVAMQKLLKKENIMLYTSKTYKNVIENNQYIFGDVKNNFNVKNCSLITNGYVKLRRAYINNQHAFINTKVIPPQLQQQYIAADISTLFNEKDSRGLVTSNDKLLIRLQNLYSQEIISSEELSDIISILKPIAAVMRKNRQQLDIIQADENVINNIRNYDKERLEKLEDLFFNEAYIEDTATGRKLRSDIIVVLRAYQNSICNIYSEWNKNRNKLLGRFYTELDKNTKNDNAVDIHNLDDIAIICRNYQLDDFLGFSPGTIIKIIRDYKIYILMIKNKGLSKTEDEDLLMATLTNIINALINFKQQHHIIDSYIRMKAAKNIEAVDFVRDYKTHLQNFFKQLQKHERTSLTSTDKDFDHPVNLFKKIFDNIRDANKIVKKQEEEQEKAKKMPKTHVTIDQVDKLYSIRNPDNPSETVQIRIVNYQSNIETFIALAYLREPDGSGTVFTIDGIPHQPWNSLVKNLLELEKIEKNFEKAQRQSYVLSTYRRAWNNQIIDAVARRKSNASKQLLKEIGLPEESKDFLINNNYCSDKYLDKYGYVSILMVAFIKASDYFNEILNYSDLKDFIVKPEADPEAALNYMVNTINDTISEFKEHKCMSVDVFQSRTGAKSPTGKYRVLRGLIVKYPAASLIDKIQDAFTNMKNKAETNLSSIFDQREENRMQTAKAINGDYIVTSKTVAEYFLALALYSLQEGIIEPNNAIKRSMNAHHLTPEQAKDLAIRILEKKQSTHYNTPPKIEPPSDARNTDENEYSNLHKEKNIQYVS